MTALADKTIGIVGALSSMSRRVAAREVSRQGGFLRRGFSRKTSIIVLGRRLLERCSDDAIDTIADNAGGARLISENGFLRLLGLLADCEPGTISAREICGQSGLSFAELRFLSMFDAFIRDAEPFTFRDMILAKKYAGLLRSGASVHAIVKSIHRSGSAGSITTLSLRASSHDQIYALFDEKQSELNGQFVFPIEARQADDIESLYAEAEEAEDRGEFEKAASLYEKCLHIDAGDSVAAFNRANCLRADGKNELACHSYLMALKQDPKMVEAWFNLAAMKKDIGETDTARRYLLSAISCDREYADAVFNLAALEFDEGNLSEARRWWERYLQLDTESEWSKVALRGMRYVEYESAKADSV